RRQHGRYSLPCCQLRAAIRLNLSVRPQDRTYEVPRAQDSAARNCVTHRHGHVGTLPSHSFTSSTNGHSPISVARCCLGGHWLLCGGCHLVPPCRDDPQSNEATLDVLIGELGHLPNHQKSHVCWLAVYSYCIGDLSLFGLGLARASGIRF